MAPQTSPGPARGQARYIRDQMPAGGLFAGQEWRISPVPFQLEPVLVEQLERLGRVLLQFNRAVNLLYRLSVAGKQPAWVAGWLDQGKPAELIELQRSPAFKNDLPRVIRPDLLLTESGIAITELDSVPGGIGLTAWLNQTYSRVPDHISRITHHAPQTTDNVSSSQPPHVIGGAEGMLRGFAGIFGDAPAAHVIVSEESSTYRPEMEWLCDALGSSRFKVRSSKFTKFATGDAVYRFFELFDLANVENAQLAFTMAKEKKIHVTPPPKTFLEEKMLFALLWNRNLRGFWRQELGERFIETLLQCVPYTWIVDPTPLPPHAAIPELDLTDWHQLKSLSHRERALILKVSGFSDKAWGARGVYLGSDLSVAEWSEAVDLALQCFARSPFVLQRYHKPRTVDASWHDFARDELLPMKGRVRLCPDHFVHGEADEARAQLGGVLATICPADKKIIHGMKDAILAPACL